MLTLSVCLRLGLSLVPQAQSAGVATWKAIATEGAPPAHLAGTVVWTGREIVVWGGCDEHAEHFSYHEDGAVYDPMADAWRPLPVESAPGARAWHSSVWTGREVLVWGGVCAEGERGDGFAFDPRTNRWRVVAALGAPAARGSHVAVWTGKAMLIWAGVTEDRAFASGGLYDPVSDTWESIRIDPGERVPRSLPGLWTGDRFLAFGGINGGAVLGMGVWFAPETGESGAINPRGAPGPRAAHTAIWTGREMIVWGGSKSIVGGLPLRDGARYDPVSDAWTPMSVAAGPTARYAHASVWTGDDLLILGGAVAREGDALADVWAWRQGAGWRPMPDLPAARAHAQARRVSRGVVLLGGRDAKAPRAGGFVLELP